MEFVKYTESPSIHEFNPFPEEDIQALKKCFDLVKENLDPEEYYNLTQMYFKYTFEPIPELIYGQDVLGYKLTIEDVIEVQYTVEYQG